MQNRLWYSLGFCFTSPTYITFGTTKNGLHQGTVVEWSWVVVLHHGNQVGAPCQVRQDRNSIKINYLNYLNVYLRSPALNYCEYLNRIKKIRSNLHSSDPYLWFHPSKMTTIHLQCFSWSLGSSRANSLKQCTCAAKLMEWGPELLAPWSESNGTLLFASCMGKYEKHELLIKSFNFSSFCWARAPLFVAAGGGWPVPPNCHCTWPIPGRRMRMSFMPFVTWC